MQIPLCGTAAGALGKPKAVTTTAHQRQRRITRRRFKVCAPEGFTGTSGGAVFTGKASQRCAVTGYWNAFTPVFDYKTLEGYIAGIEYFVSKGLLAAPSELYFPVRLKPRGLNTLDNLRTLGASHIELRMFDLNPLDPVGLELRDI